MYYDVLESQKKKVEDGFMKNWITRFTDEYYFLSNFYPCLCEFEGLEYPTAEHAFQAAKTLDPQKRVLIQHCISPGAAKKMGKHVDLRKDWENIKGEVMLVVLRSKFENRELKEKLLSTEDSILIEGNSWCDNGWGVCFCEECNGIGKNMLGTLLMQVREEIKLA